MKPGDRVYHRSLQLYGIVVDAGAVGHLLDPGWTSLVEFDDGETREVTSTQLVLVEKA